MDAGAIQLLPILIVLGITAALFAGIWLIGRGRRP